jgi:hypothetical protein
MVQIAWWWSQSGPTGGYQPWGDEPLKLSAGSAVWVRVAATTDPDAAAVDGHANFVVPVGVEALSFGLRSGDYEHALVGAENENVGQPPDHQVRFFSAERRLTPSFTWVAIYLVVIPIGVDGEVPLLYEVVADGQEQSKRLVSVTG